MRILPSPLILLTAVGMFFTPTIGTAGSESHDKVKIPDNNQEISSPEGGVHLLERILERMRNSPQFALSKNKQTIAFASQEQLNRPNSCEPNLLIKPKDLTRVLAKAKMLSDAVMMATSVNRSVDAFSAAKECAASQGKSSAPPNVWERNEEQNSAIENANFRTDESTRSIGGVVEYDANNGDGSVHRKYQARRVISTTPLITEFQAGQNRLHVFEAPNNLLSDKSKDKSVGAPRQATDLCFHLSILPPTVIAGVATVQLGNSEKEVTKAVSSFDEIKKELVHGWSIWSIHRPKAKNCALQIFFRRGIVEAIRVFDATFCRADLGVTLGDGLGVVKEKFGEPSFILTEPSVFTTQNYIYPISQIGFQLARHKINNTPKIVSILIFNVR